MQRGSARLRGAVEACKASKGRGKFISWGWGIHTYLVAVAVTGGAEVHAQQTIVFKTRRRRRCRAESVAVVRNVGTLRRRSASWRWLSSTSAAATTGEGVTSAAWRSSTMRSRFPTMSLG
uniref:Uncharacterized protein n=1 Tax=Zea mays TaxID=4577 RepID=A0A804ULR3_MAIZE